MKLNILLLKDEARGKWYLLKVMSGQISPHESGTIG